MAVIPAPPLDDRQVPAKLSQHVFAGHQATGEEVAAHPVRIAVGFVGIREHPMTEMMYEELSVRAQPGRDSLQKPFVVSHVLEHFHGDDSVEAARLDLEFIHVGGDDTQVCQSARGRFRFDEVPLRSRL